MFDSHLHLTDESFREDLVPVLARAREAGIRGMLAVATDPEDAERALELARGEVDVWASAGLHPHEAAEFSGEVLIRIRELAGEEKVVAIGETGLDFHYDNASRADQRASFDGQLELAARTDLPVIVHSRDADDQTAELIGGFAGRVRGVLHCFTGGWPLLEAGLAAGWFVSFSGIVTFRGFDAAELVRRVPAGRLLIETDSPYLAPEPRRGKRNEPALLRHVCERVAELRGVSVDEIAERTRTNARELYGLEGR